MFTIIESPLFSRLWPDYWTESERARLAAFLARNPKVGKVIPGSGGCRKVRWSRAGVGRRGGVRVIYAAYPDREELVLLVVYAKSARDNIPAHTLRKIAAEMGHGT